MLKQIKFLYVAKGEQETRLTQNTRLKTHDRKTGTVLTSIAMP